MTEITLRHAILEDSRNIWLWRNDPDTRANSKNRAPIEWPDHERWFTNTLEDPQCVHFLVHGPEGSIGIVRFDLDQENRFEVSINLAPHARGRGFGKLALAEACSKALSEHPQIVGIDATVRVDNPQSFKLFLACGFQEISRADGMIKLTFEPR